MAPEGGPFLCPKDSGNEVSYGENMKQIISLTTDFGDTFACAQLETVILSINPDIKFVVASHQITAFSLIEGAFVLSKFSPLAPSGSIHIAVIDPGVGSERRGIILRGKDYWYVGPDNGSLYPAALQDNLEKAWVISEEKIGSSLSNTFHGRDVFAKVAAYLSIDKSPEELGNPLPLDQLVKLSLENNQVTHIDPYGNIKLSSSSSFIFGDILEINFENKKFTVPFCKTFADVKPGELLVYLGSHQTLELAQNLGNGNKIFDFKVGDVLSIQKVR